MTRLALTRSGGFGGTVQRFEVDEDHLAPAERAELRRLIAAAGLDELPDELGARVKGGVDRFTYRLTIEEGGTVKSVRFTELEMTEGLRELVRWIEGRG